MGERATTLEIGRLLRMRGMVAQAAQINATAEAARPLIETHNNLRGELVRIVAGVPHLQEELERVSALIPNPASGALPQAAQAAQIGLRVMEGWIQGLIDEQTLLLQIEANAKAAAKPPTGFQGGES